MNDEYIRIIKSWADDPYVTHDDVTKCGLCWREQIKSEICKELLQSGQEIDKNSFIFVLDESKRRWQETHLYKRVNKMLNEGKELTSIELELREEGIEI